MRALILALAAVLACAGSGRAAPIPTHNVVAALVSSRAAIAPGEHFTLALRQVIRPGWHTYWRNAGDSGIPTSLKWSLPAGFAAGEIEWPAPRAIRVDTLVNYGFEGEVLFPVEIAAPADLKVGTVASLKAHAAWLVCKEICIPEDADLSLEAPVRAAGADDVTWAGPISAARAALPRPAAFDARLAPDAPTRDAPTRDAPTRDARTNDAGTKDARTWELELSGGALAPLLKTGDIRNPAFFPYAGDLIDHAAPQAPRVSADMIALTLTPAPIGNLGAGPIKGVLTYEARRAGVWRAQAAEIDAPPSAAPARPHAGAGLGLVAALGFALVGGLILNVMPCVFPVLSMKALSLARGGDEREARRHGVFFLAGVLFTFLALAVALIALQAAGAQIGWGFQLQEPLVVGALGLLFFAIGLNLLGAFEIGAGLQGLGSGLAARGGDAGAFFTGALAVIAATPCTAPYMGAAMGYAATQPPQISLLVFVALGLGFAAPFFLLSVAPPLRGFLPKPGAWMETFKQFLAFPMFAASIWLVWVLSQQAGGAGLLALLAAFLAFGFLVWALRAFRGRGARVATAALAIAALAAAGFGVHAARAVSPGAGAAREGRLAIQTWTPAREAALRAEGKAVFVNFTASWCVTCQVNERVALQSSEVAAAFARGGVAYLKADWTARDPVIAGALKAQGRAGVPLYLYYAPRAGVDAPPVVLPQLLTPAIVVAAIDAAPSTTASSKGAR